MFNNIGQKVMTLASTVCWIMIIACVIFGIYSASIADSFLPFILIGVGGSFVSWISSFALYAFGQMTDDMSYMRSLLEKQYGVAHQIEDIEGLGDTERPLDNNQWRCSHCGAVNTQKSRRCRKCDWARQ